MTKCQQFIEGLDKLNKFRLHTGNVNAYSELKLRRFKNSAEELSACLDLQLQSTPTSSEFSDDGTLLLCDNAHINNYERDDLKITMKVFMKTWKVSELQDSVKCLKSELVTDNIEMLIVATPELDVVDGESEADEVKRWIALMTPLWDYLTKLVETNDVVSLGLSDATVSQLEELFDKFDVHPTVNHINLDGCCAVSPELQAFAKKHDIQLLTHNDPYPFPTTQVFNTFCDIRQASPVCCSHFETTWAARYTVWVRRRSVMASKGYIVQFVKK